jgi:filamentous hemagglutinin family protein
MTPIRLNIAILVIVLASLGIFRVEKVHAQSIKPAQDGTGTLINQQGNVFSIRGGKLSGNGENLFHSFQQFGLTSSQSANFLSNPTIRNIFGRIVGGEASQIDGLIQVFGGNSNLFLMNPAGIIFGANARLNVPTSFTATTATSIGFGDRWFNAFGDNNYLMLSGNPSAFAFALKQPSFVVNAGNLAVGNGQQLTLIGGSVINTGTLTAPGGQITVAAVPGEHLIRIRQPGILLSLEIQPLGNRETSGSGRVPMPAWFNPPTLPELLTGGNLSHATGLQVDADGTIRLVSSSAQISGLAGAVTISGAINVLGDRGGSVNVIGNQVKLSGGAVNASGVYGGGMVRIGGDYQGQGTLPNAQNTVVSPDSLIRADALLTGNGGRVIIWADGTTWFGGTVTARGGSLSGNGGFVEISGKRNLSFGGQVDTSAVNGAVGSLLLDPTNITIASGNGGIAPDDQELLTTGQLVGDRNYAISQNTLQALASRTTFTLQANDNITIQPLVGNTLDLAQTTGTFSLIAGNTISMTPSNSIVTGGAGITLQANTLAPIEGIQAGGTNLVSNQLELQGGLNSIRSTPGVPTQIVLGIVD